MPVAIDELVAEVKENLRKKCWYVSCGGAASTTFELALGKKVRRGFVVRNPAHSWDFRNFEGEANLLVWCTWRLDGANGPLTSSNDTVEHVVAALERLTDKTIVDVRVDLPGWDLHLEFSGGLRLHVFCDHVPGDPSFDGNWELTLTNRCIAIGIGSKCEVEPRAPWELGGVTPGDLVPEGK